MRSMVLMMMIIREKGLISNIAIMVIIKDNMKRRKRIEKE
jgi:hypothetical protein